MTDKIKSLAVAVAGNITDPDNGAVLVVAQAGGQFRVTPIGTDFAGALQLLGSGVSVIAGKIRPRPTAAPAAAPAPAPVPARAIPVVPMPTNGTWKQIAKEGETADVPAGSTVRYGANGKFVTRALAGKVACDNTTFGDPSPNALKTCELFVPAATAAKP